MYVTYVCISSGRLPWTSGRPLMFGTAPDRHRYASRSSAPEGRGKGRVDTVPTDGSRSKRLPYLHTPRTEVRVFISRSARIPPSSWKNIDYPYRQNRKRSGLFRPESIPAVPKHRPVGCDKRNERASFDRSVGHRFLGK